MSRGSSIASKTIIYTIGNFGSRLLAFFLVPYYTYVISTSDMGSYDFALAALELLIPFITLQMPEAIVSGLIKKEIDESKIIKASEVLLLINLAITVIGYLLFSTFFEVQWGRYYVCMVCIQSLYKIMQHYVRGLSNSKLYSLCGVIYTFLYLIQNIIYLSVMKLGVLGLLISSISSHLVVVLIILFAEPAIFKALFTPLDYKTVKWIITYSLPLIPNAISWWFINLSDRFVIKYYIGSDANGIFAISHKFISIVVLFTGLFYMAWQEVSIEEYDSPDKAEFFSKTFNIYMKFLLGIAILGMGFTKLYVIQFMNISYHDAWKYVMWLYVASAYSALASFLNTGYLVSGDTNSILKGTFIAGVVNISIDLLLVNVIGIYAASLSTLVSSFVLLIHRLLNNKQFYTINVDWWSFGFLSLFAIGASVAFLTSTGSSTTIIMTLLCVIVAVFYNYKFVMQLVQFAKHYISTKDAIK